MVTPEKRKEYRIKYRQEHPENVKESRRKNYLSHKEHVNEKTKQYYKEHPEKIRESVAKWTRKKKEANPEEYAKQNAARFRDYYNKNKEKFKAARDKWNKAHPEEMRAASYKYHIKKKYGLTIEEHTNMIEAQGNRCKICNEEMSTPHVDHDHITGKVRGLLCPNCNTGLGKFKDSVPNLLRAVAYLEENLDK